MRIATRLLASTLAVLIGCDEGFIDPPVIARDTGAAVQTDSLAYHIRSTSVLHETTVAFTFTNRDPRAVEIANCNGFTSAALEKLVDERWVLAWSPVLPECLSQPIVVAPGASYQSQITISFGGPGVNIEPAFIGGTVTGVYRLVWGALSYRGAQAADVPVAERISNRFTLAGR